MTRFLFLALVAVSGWYSSLSMAQAPTPTPAPGAKTPRLPPGVEVEKNPTDPKALKIVFIAGSNSYKPGEHEYIAGCALLMDMVRQTKSIEPVFALDWPKNPETLKNAQAVVLLFDGGDKHAVLKGNRLKELQALSDAGVGLIQLHQVADYPKELGDRARAMMGAAWEKGHSLRGHWVDEFQQFPEHPITRGVTSFKLDDGWLWKLKFVPEMKGVTPLLRTVNPKSTDDPKANNAIIAWAYQREGKGRSFTFTGTHLHASYEQAGYRKFLVNGILWAAGIEIPATGAPCELKQGDTAKYLSAQK